MLNSSRRRQAGVAWGRAQPHRGYEAHLPRRAKVIKTDMKVEDGKLIAYRTRVSLSFKYDA